MHAKARVTFRILNASPTNEPGKAVGRCRHTLTRRMPKPSHFGASEQPRHNVSLYSCRAKGSILEDDPKCLVSKDIVPP
jgi:hypothetical protein